MQVSTSTTDIGEAIAAYLEAQDEGRAPVPEAFIERYPHLTKELTEFFAAQDQFVQMAADTGPIAEATTELTANAPAAGATFGDYELLAKIGEGGMGVVYRARQRGLNRVVALKLILAGRAARQTDRDRFRIEAEAAAGLSHDGIVHVYEVGEHAGYPYLAMEYCSGGSLADRLDGLPLAARTAAGMIRHLAHAVQAAHEARIVHRDLKPANILIVADGRLKIADFGLARRLDESDRLTRTNAILGSPPYMSPEQASGDGIEVGPATDIYALGAILYELLTGQPPFRGATPMETVQRVVRDPVVRPRQRVREIPRDLETICLRCLDKSPSCRFATASDLAAELERFLDGTPIHSRPIGPVGRAWRWYQRNPAVATMAGVLAAALLVGTAISVRYALRAEEKSADAMTAKLTAEEAKEQAIRFAEEKSDAVEALLDNQYVADLRAAHTAIEAGDADQALAILHRHDPKPGEFDRRTFAWHYLVHECRHSQGVLARGPRCVNSLALSPDGKWLAVGENYYKFCLRNAETGAVVWRTSLPGDPYEIQFSPDGSKLAVACGAGRAATPPGVMIFDVKPGTPKAVRLGGNAKVGRCLAFSRMGTLLACAGDGGKIEIWNYASQKKYAETESTAKSVDRLVFTPDGKSLIAAIHADSVRQWIIEPGTMKKSKNLVVASRPVPIRDRWFARSTWRAWPVAMAISPDGTTLAVSFNGPTISLKDLSSSTSQLVSLGDHDDAVSALGFTPDGKRLISSGLDRGIRIWDLNRKAEVTRLGGHHDVATALAIFPDGNSAVSGGDDGSIRKWRIPATNDPPDRLTSRTKDLVEAVTFLPGGEKLASGTVAGSLRIQSTRTDEVVQDLIAEGEKPARVFSLSPSPNGERLACLRPDRQRGEVWDVKSGQRLFHIPFDGLSKVQAHDILSNQIEYSADGKTIVIALSGGIRISDAENGKPIRMLEGHRFAFSPDGRHFASRTETQITIRDGSTFEQQVFLPVKSPQGDLAFSMDGRLIAFEDNEETIVVWDMIEQRLLHRMSGHTAQITDIAFCPDGQSLVSASDDGRCIVWDLVTGKAQIELRGHAADLKSVAFPKDGRILATAGYDDRIHLWRAPTLDCAAIVDSRNVVARARRFLRIERGEIQGEKVGETHEDILVRFTQAIEQDPHNPKSWEERGHYLRGFRRWKEAARDYDKAIELGTTRILIWCDSAESWLMAGEEAQYERVRNDLLQKIADSQATDVQRPLVVRVACLRPLPGDQKLIDALLRAAESIWKLEPKSWRAIHIHTVVLFRLGKFDEALARSLSQPPNRGRGQFAITLIWRALIQQRLGNSDEAKATHANAVQTMKLVGHEEVEDLGLLKVHNTVEFTIIEREVQNLFGTIQGKN